MLKGLFTQAFFLIFRYNLKIKVMEEQGILLESASFKFSQDANCLSHRDDYEFLTIECKSDLGIDRDQGCFYVLETKKWSIKDEQDLKLLFNRIQKVIKK